MDTHHTSWLPLAASFAMILVAVITTEFPENSLALSTNSSTSAGGTSQRVPARCRPEQAAALLQLKRSFSFRAPANTTSLSSWRASTDCCSWEGVGCDQVTGRVTSLDLHGRCLQICGGLHPVLFNLTSLQHLDLAENNFCGSQLPESSFERLTKLEVLILDSCNLSGPIPPSFSGLHSLEEIHLSSNNLNGSIPVLFSAYNFPRLRILDLSVNPFEGTFPLEITHLKNLRVLDLWGMNLFGGIPDSIGNLSSLTELYLTWNSFSGGLPRGLSNMTWLTKFDCSRCGLSGRVPSLASLTRLEYISLAYNNLTGPIPLLNEGSMHPNLTVVELRNNLLSGTVPASIFSHSTLQELYLDRNQLSGSIEEFQNPSQTLTDVDLSYNELTGAVPASFLQLTALRVLGLDSNNFTGTVDLDQYFQLRNLSSFTASYNLLTVIADGNWDNYSCPNSIINVLELASCNLTRLPSAIRCLHELDYLDLSYNGIGGKIPDWMWRNMTSLDLSNNLFSEVAQIPAYTHISHIDLSFNRLHGVVPLPSTGDSLDYSNNKFSCTVPINFHLSLMTASFINLANNELSGPIPFVECHRNEHLTELDLSGNNFSGLIPPCLLKSSIMLEVLNLRGNRLEGTWPDEMDASCSLEAIDLHGNRIAGRLPRSLANCTYLQYLDVGENNFVDSFPSWLGNLPELRILILRSNQFFGPLSTPHLKKNQSTTDYFSSLQIIDLAGNGFTGALSPEFFDSLKSMVRPPDNPSVTDNGDPLQFAVVKRAPLPQRLRQILFYLVPIEVAMKQQYMRVLKVQNDLVVIDLSNNRFNSSIPRSVANLTFLHVLNLSHNAFTREIPWELGHLARIESLDLSWNHLTGEIPQELASLTALEWLNLSYNDLSGSIPSGPQFSTFPSSSFQGGNRGLYGCPLPVRCNLTHPSLTTKAPPPGQVPDGPSADHRFDVIMLCIFVGSGFGVGFALAIVSQVVCGRRGVRKWIRGGGAY